jgi:hypothetical protein
VGSGCSVGDGVTFASENSGIPTGVTCNDASVGAYTAAVGTATSGGGAVTTIGVATHAASSDEIRIAMMAKRVPMPLLLRTRDDARLLSL